MTPKAHGKWRKSSHWALPLPLNMQALLCSNPCSSSEVSSFLASSFTLLATVHVSVLYLVLGHKSLELPQRCPQDTTRALVSACSSHALTKDYLQSCSFFGLENPHCFCGDGGSLPSAYEMDPWPLWLFPQFQFSPRLASPLLMWAAWEVSRLFSYTFYFYFLPDQHFCLWVISVFLHLVMINQKLEPTGNILLRNSLS